MQTQPIIHLICPFYRKHLLPTHINYLKPTGIYWHPVCDPIDIKAFDAINESWIYPFLCSDLIGLKKDNPIDARACDKATFNACFGKINAFINAGNIIDDDYYGFMGDDDSYEPGFFDVIRQQTAKILMFSLSRGNAIPHDAFTRHPTSPLIISSHNNVRAGAIGLPQYIMKGVILKQMRLRMATNCDDGYFAEELVARFLSDIKFLPEIFAFGNFFEPGRYTDTSFKLKANWELPRFIPVP